MGKDIIIAEPVPENRVPDNIRNGISVQRRQNISDSAREKIFYLCRTIEVCRENPAIIGEFGVDGYDIYLMHANSLNLKYGDGFIITRNGIYCKRWNAKKYEAPAFTLFEDIARADIIRYEGKYQFTLVYPNQKEKPLAYYTDCAGTKSIHNLFLQIANICINELFPSGKKFKLLR